MKKKLPGVFVNAITKPFNNNQNVFCSFAKAKSDEIEEKSGNLVMAKINEMFASPQYVYQIRAIIKMKNGTELTKDIIGIAENKLITIDEEYIPLTEIVDINY